jgi:hypothetical protein
MTQPVEYLDAGLAKRLAEAADCFRDGLYHYFICKNAPPYDLYFTKGYSVAEDAYSEAQTQKTTLGETYDIYGAYKTESSNEPPVTYDSLKLSFIENNQVIHSTTFDGTVDAIILSVSAFDKFFLPYYVRLYGIAIAQEIRNNAVNELTSSATTSATHHGLGKTADRGGTKFAAGSYQY